MTVLSFGLPLSPEKPQKLDFDSPIPSRRGAETQVAFLPRRLGIRHAERCPRIALSVDVHEFGKY
jgi:hypothetical protein